MRRSRLASCGGGQRLGASIAVAGVVAWSRLNTDAATRATATHITAATQSFRLRIIACEHENATIVQRKQINMQDSILERSRIYKICPCQKGRLWQLVKGYPEGILRKELSRR